VYTQFRSGARRIAIDLDATATSCKATVVVGKENGKALLRRRAEIFSTQIGSVSCTFREGNVFGH
jgi:hypothetical protein